MKKILGILLVIGTFLYATVPDDESVTKLYIATFDRAPDIDGLKYWVNDSKLSLEEIAQSFFDQAETKDIYPADSTYADLIKATYANIFGRSPDVAGYNYWLNQLNDGKINRSVFILAIINGALGDDSQLIENKTIVGLAFAKDGRNNLNDARDILKGVTIDESSIDEALLKFGILTTADITLNKRDIVETIAKEWYVRIVIEDTTNNMKTAAAQLGQLDISDAVVKHTLKAIAPFRPTYLDVVFVNPIGVDAGSYKSNFHLSSTSADSWEFTVKSNDTTANMILGWRGIYVLSPYIDDEGRERYHEYRSMTNPLLSYMTLVDVNTNAEIPILSNGTVNEYVFNMDGATERKFRWKVKDTSSVAISSFRAYSKISKPTQEEKLKKLQIQALRKDAKARPDTLERKRLESFDMSIPPTFEVLVK